VSFASTRQNRKHLTPKQELEREVTKATVDFLRSKGWRIVRHQRYVSPGQFQSGEPGMADTQAIYYMPGSLAAVVFWIEFKRRIGGKVGEHQTKWHERERERGGTVIVVSDVKTFCEWYDRELAFLRQEPWLRGQRELQLEEDF
jgi:hypothetical protein